MKAKPTDFEYTTYNQPQDMPPYTVHMTHKQSGKVVKGHGHGFFEARMDAMKQWETLYEPADGDPA